MSKSRSRKWYEHYDPDESVDNKSNKHKDRRKEKQLKNALKARDFKYLEQVDD